PKAYVEAVALMALSYLLLFTVCAAMLILLGVYELGGWNWPALEILGPWAWLLPLGVLLSGGLTVQEQWLTRESAFRLSAASIVLGSAITGGVRIFFGSFWGSSVFGLITGNLVGLLSRIIVQRKVATFDGMKAGLRFSNIPDMRRVAREYSDFPKLNAPAGLIFALGQN